MAKKSTADHSPRSRKSSDQAFILPFVGLIFLIPPFASIFQIDTLIAGVPFTALYLFFIWGLLIVGAAILSRRLREQQPTEIERESATNIEK